MHIAIRLGRQRSGGMSSFVHNLSSAISNLPGEHKVSFAYVGEEWADLSGESHSFGARNFADEYRVDAFGVGRWCDAAGVDLLVCPGNQASSTSGRTIWWPLTVAPYEQIGLNELATGAAGRARWAAVRSSLKVSAKLADGVVFSSNYARALYDAGLSGGIGSKPTTVIRPSTSIDVHDRSPSSPPFLLSVSNFNRYKFLAEIIQAFALSDNRRNGWGLRLVGRFPDKAYEAEVRALVDELDIVDLVDIAGELAPSALPAVYAKASGFVFASVSENAASYTVIDALAYGLPVVSSFYSSTPEILGNCVLYADPFSVDDLSTQMSRIVDIEESARLSSASLLHAAKFPTWSDIAAGLVSFAEDALQLA